MLNLPVHVGVRYGSPVDADVMVIIELEEFLPRKLCVIVGYDGVWYFKAMDDIKEE